MAAIHVRIKHSETHGVKVLLFDDAGVELYDRYTWSVMKVSRSATYYLTRKSANSSIYFHRELLGNIRPGLVVDHINHNGLDNRLENLRICTQQENMRNQAKHSDNKSGVKGVHWRDDVNKWRAEIWVNSKNKHLGYFDNLEDAKKTYNDAAIKYFGIYAHLNP